MCPQLICIIGFGRLEARHGALLGIIFKLRQKFKFAFHENLSLVINRANVIFQLPGLIFSRTLSIFKQELPEKSRFWR